jgi:hypothetical protein
MLRSHQVRGQGVKTAEKRYLILILLRDAELPERARTFRGDTLA